MDAPVGDEAFWTDGASTGAMSAWRNKHRDILDALIGRGDGRPQKEWGDMAKHLAATLVYRPDGPMRQHTPTEEDRTAFMTLLGHRLADAPLRDGTRFVGESPILLVLDRLFTFWIQRGCQGAFVLDRARGDLVWKTRPGRHDSLQQHWATLLISGVLKCGRRIPDWRGLDYLQPWRGLRADMEIFLSSWATRVGLQPEPDSVALRADMSSLGLKCLALRSMATIEPRRIPGRLADRLFDLERWMGRGDGLVPGAVVVGAGLAREQLVAWERYLIRRAAVGVRKRSRPAEDSHGPIGLHRSGAVRPRKM